MAARASRLLDLSIMAATTTHLMTVEEFQSLPEDYGGVYHELHHGELVTLTRPKFNHWLIQNNLADLLRPLAEPGARVGLEMPFRPLLSPSNTVTDREQICLPNGTKEFWVVDPDRLRIKVTASDGRSTFYGSGQRIPLPLFGPAASLAVDDVFRD